MRNPATKLVTSILGICLGVFLVVNFIGGVRSRTDSPFNRFMNAESTLVQYYAARASEYERERIRQIHERQQDLRRLGAFIEEP